MWIGFLAISQASELRQTPVVRAVREAAPAVVNIRGEKTVTETTGYGRSESARRVNGMGTGVVIDQRGYIVTNYHVVEGVRRIEVTEASGARHVAQLFARDPHTDLAIIKVKPEEPLTVIPLGRSSDLMPGETVIAVGNAYGYEDSVTLGIVSALHRAVQVSDAQFYEDLIQTDASINPGNSGGPLLNVDGEMIGLNVAVRAGAQGIGFAIPVDRVVAVVSDLIESKVEEQAWHGIEFEPEPRGDGNGAVVSAVEPGSPAEEAGLKRGDALVAVEGVRVERALDFSRAMLDEQAGQSVGLTLEREGDSVHLDLTLAKASRSRQPARNSFWDVLGMELEPISSEEFRRRFRTRYRGGLTVTAVKSGGPASRQGIKPGDVLVGMHIWETISMANVSYIVNRSDFSEFVPVKFFILRGDETLYGYLPVALTEARRR